GAAGSRGACRPRCRGPAAHGRRPPHAASPPRSAHAPRRHPARRAPLRRAARRRDSSPALHLHDGARPTEETNLPCPRHAEGEVAHRMHERLVFLIGSPRSGSTLTARMLGAHSAVYAPAETHLLTPLAHLRLYAKVEKAPYDPIITRQGAHELVRMLPGGEEDYLAALRACSDTIYERLLAASGRQRLLEKTPAYALVLDFLAKLYPKAKYLVLTRHPPPVWSADGEAVFDGDHEAAHLNNPLLERYVPAIARFLREGPVPLLHLRYEQLVREPHAELGLRCGFLG